MCSPRSPSNHFSLSLNSTQLTSTTLVANTGALVLAPWAGTSCPPVAVSESPALRPLTQIRHPAMSAAGAEKGPLLCLAARSSIHFRPTARLPVLQVPVAGTARHPWMMMMRQAAPPWQPSLPPAPGPGSQLALSMTADPLLLCSRTWMRGENLVPVTYMAMHGDPTCTWAAI